MNADWRKGITVLRTTPALLLAQKVLRRVPFRPVDIGKLCFLRLDGVPHVAPSQLRGTCLVRRGTPDDLAGLVSLQDRGPAFRERFAAGDQCVVAIAGDRIIGFEWFCDRPVHHEAAWGYPIPIPEGFVYAYDAYVDPSFRNTGVWLRFKAYLADWMTERGKQGVLTFVEYGNRPSFRTHVRFGFIPGETVLALRMVGIRFFRRMKALEMMCLWLCCGPARPLLHTFVHACATIRLR